MNIALCPNCEQAYTDLNPPKILINCQHTICFQCLQTEILCPVDHKRIERRKYTVEAFQNNLKLMQQLANKQKGDEKQEENCSENCQRAIQTPKKEINFEQKILKEQSLNTNNKISSQKKQKSVSKEQKKDDEMIQFEYCLLHNKKADLICMDDKCLICANCGLFGEHKTHRIMPYDRFALSFGALTENCLKMSDQLKQKEEKVSEKTVEDQIEQQLQEMRRRESQNIEQFTTNIIRQVKDLQLNLLQKLQQTLKARKEKIIESINTKFLSNQLGQFNKVVDNLNQGINCVFTVDNIEQYIGFVDDNKIEEKGQQLIHAFDQKYAEIDSRIRKDFDEILFHFQSPSQSLFTPLIGSQKKLVAVSPSAKKNEDLLLNPNSSKGKENNGGLSPITPVAHFDDAPDSHFQEMVRLNQISIPTPKPPRHPNSKMSMNRRDEHHQGSTTKTYSRTKSINSSNHTEREFINMLTQNQAKKKKKLDLPQKYSKIYDQLQKDHLEVLDLGGAFLGQSTILKIMELVPTRTKLKSIKLMNNKIGDEAFPEIVDRCKNINSLNLSYNNLTEKVLDYLENECGQLGQLYNITLSNNKIVLRNVRDRLQMLKRQGVKVSL